MGVSTGIDHDPLCPTAILMDEINEAPLAVGLMDPQLAAVLAAKSRSSLLIWLRVIFP